MHAIRLVSLRSVDIKVINFGAKMELKYVKCCSRFQATPSKAFSRRAPEQNVQIFPARHARCVIWHGFSLTISRRCRVAVPVVDVARPV